MAVAILLSLPGIVGSAAAAMPADTTFLGRAQTFDALADDRPFARFATLPGDSIVWKLVSEGPGGSRCLRVDARREHRDELPRDAEIWIPLDPVAGEGPPRPDSTWVLQWAWKVRDVDTSGGITLSAVVRDYGWRTPFSHQLFTDPIGSFDIAPMKWSAHRVVADTLQKGMRAPLPPAAEWGVLVQVSWPRDQTVWVDDVYFGPPAFAPPLPESYGETAVLDPRDMAYGGIVGELDAGGPPLLILPNRTHHRAYAYQLDGRGVPIDRAQELGLTDLGGGGGGAMLDLDDDGDPDLVVANERTVSFWENDGWDRFRRVPAVDPPLPPLSVYQVAPGDFDEDGRTDLWVVRSTGPDDLLRNEGGLRFRALDAYPLEGEAAALADIVRLTLDDQYSVTVADFDADGHADVFVSSLGEERGPPLLLFGTGRFTFDRCLLMDYWPPGGPRTLAPYPGMPADGREVHGCIEGAAAVDLDRDGDLDLVIARDYPKGHPAPNEVLFNDGTGRFTPCAESWMQGFPGRSEASLPGDFDNDGWPDLYEVNHGENRHLRNDRGRGLIDVTPDSPFANFSHSAMGIVADLDLDGREDVVLFEDDAALPHLRLMNTAPCGGSVRVRIRGTISGHDAVGAELRVHAPASAGGELLGYRQRLQGIAFGSASWGPDAFGIGGLAECDVEVRFPSGVVRRVRGVRAGTTATVWEIRPGAAGALDRVRAAVDPLRRAARRAGRAKTWGGLAVPLLLAALLVARRAPRPAPATALAWRRLLDLLASESEHWAKNLVAVQRRASTLAESDLDAGARESMTPLLDATLTRIRDEDVPRFRTAVTTVRDTLARDDPARADGQRFVDALDTLSRRAAHAAAFPAAELRDLASAAARAREAGSRLLVRAERECSLPAAEVRRFVAECLRERLARQGGALHDAGGDASDARVVVDREDLRSILVNLARNACEAVPSRRVRVTLSTVEREGRWSIRIADDGPGVDPAVADRLFGEGVSTKGTDRGTGLGESRRAASRMHGKLELADPGGRGRGATFALTLRTARDEADTGGTA